MLVAKRSSEGFLRFANEAVTKGSFTTFIQSTPAPVLCQTLLALEKAEQFLRPDQSADQLCRQAARQSDTEAARQMQTGKQKLFASFRKSA